jgi:hypothetical protein
MTLVYEHKAMMARHLGICVTLSHVKIGKGVGLIT